MQPARANVIADILEEHFEELSFLWGQRLAALNSPVLTLRDVQNLEERIEAHVDGLLAAGESAIPLLVPSLLDSAPNVAFAAAYSLLRVGQTAVTQQVWKAFCEAQSEGLTGLCQALCACCPAELKPRLIELAAGAPSAQSAAALEVLAYCSRKDVKPEKVAAFLKADSPRLQQLGFRLVALADISIPREPYEKALTDKNPDTRRECLWAAACTKQPWLLDYCRKFAAKSLPAEALPYRLLAILGQPDDLQRMLYLGKDTTMGPQRFEWLGAFGHPGVIDFLLAEFKAKNPRDAVVAGKAFTKITGFDVASPNRVLLPPEDGHEPDELEKEFLDDAFLPDLGHAQAYWQKVKDKFSNGSRWCHGKDCSNVSVDRDYSQFEFLARAGVFLRAKQLNICLDTPADIERFSASANMVRSELHRA